MWFLSWSWSKSHCVWSVCACVHARACLCVRVFVRVCRCVFSWPCVCVCVCVCVCEWVRHCLALLDTYHNLWSDLHAFIVPLTNVMSSWFTNNRNLCQHRFCIAVYASHSLITILKVFSLTLLFMFFYFIINSGIILYLFVYILFILFKYESSLQSLYFLFYQFFT